jgi:hypothetical protein
MHVLPEKRDKPQLVPPSKNADMHFPPCITRAE